MRQDKQEGQIMASFLKNQRGHQNLSPDYVPGTYQIRITRVEDTGKQKSLTAYVPITPRGRKELIRRHFCGVPHRKPEYFMKQNELRRF